MFGLQKKQSNTSFKGVESAASFIGEDVIVQGNIISNTSIRIDGKVAGSVNAEKLIIIGEKAEVKGNLSAKTVIVYGKLWGNVSAVEAQIKKNGVIHGDITVQAIEIEMGGKYNGKLMMNSEQREMNERQKARELKPEAVVPSDVKNPEIKNIETKVPEAKPVNQKPEEPKNGVLIE